MPIAIDHSGRYSVRMTKTEVLNHFGGAVATARALGISQPSVSNWSEDLPELRQLEIENLTAGVLRASPECDKYRVQITPTDDKLTKLVGA